MVDAVDEEAAAVEAVKSKEVDAIVLDLQLRVGTGFGVVQRLGTERPTIIVFTNYVLPEYERRAKDLGIRTSSTSPPTTSDCLSSCRNSSNRKSPDRRFFLPAQKDGPAPSDAGPRLRGTCSRCIRTS